MKKLIILLFLLLPIISKAQTVILNLDQPPEFGFEPGRLDTAILKGESVTLASDLVVFGGSGEYLYYWSPGKSLNDSTIIHPIATPEDKTNYQLTVVETTGCNFTLIYKVNVQSDPTALPRIKGKDSGLTVKLVPNPSKGKFKIQLNGNPQRKIQLAIIDNSGRIIQEKIIEEFTGALLEEIEMFLPKGIYNLLVNSENDRLQRQLIIN